uniref:GRF-type domain-containing protein n=1 Tax=Hucho hucho TaxID=62062 RepID=A0A4W5K787_9TELE
MSSTPLSNRKYLSCVGYPECKCSVWFPDTVLEVNRDESVCPTCQPRPVHMLKLKFRRGSLPPMMPLDFVGCIGGCDETLREVLNLRYLRMGGGGVGGGVGGAGGGRGGGRGDTATNQPRPRPAPRPRPDPLSPQAPHPRPDPQAPPPDPRGGDITVCNCGSEAVLLTVRKDGPNQGRQFYKCSSGGCNFFLWSDTNIYPPGPQGAPPSRPHQPPRTSAGVGRGGGGGEAGAVGDVVCNCSEPAVQRTVQKEGPNKGRVFHTCGKPRDQQCGFFLWADENVPPPGSVSGGGERGGYGERGGDWGKRGRKNGGGGGAPPTKPTAAKKPRTCGICHMPGHTRVTCPQR